MTREEVKKIIMIINETYTSFGFTNKSQEDKRMTVDIWYKVLETYEYRDIERALLSYITNNTTGFHPQIAHLIQTANKLTGQEKEYENEELAWARVYKAICNSSYNAEEEFNKLPELCKRAIGTPANLKEIASIDNVSVTTVEKSHFVRNYRAEVEKQKQIDAIPPKIKAEYGIEEKKTQDAIEDKLYEVFKETEEKHISEESFKKFHDLKEEWGA